MLIHLVDLSAPGEDRAPLHDLDVLDRELERYSPELAKKPQIVAANKIDLPEARERLAPFQAAMAERGVPVFPISAATGEGLGPLLDAVAQVLSGGALPTLGRSARPRRRPRADAPSAAGAARHRGGTLLRPRSWRASQRTARAGSPGRARRARSQSDAREDGPSKKSGAPRVAAPGRPRESRRSGAAAGRIAPAAGKARR